MLYFISNLFSSHKNFGYCSLHLILKHAGIGLIYIILFIHIYSGIELGVKDSKDKKLKVISMNSDKDINEIYESLESLKIKRQSNIIESKPIELSVNSSRQNISFNEVMKNIKKTHYLYIEGLFLYTIFITITIIYITTKTFKYKSRNRLEQDNSGYWLYMCPSEKYELIVNIFEFLFIFILLLKIKKLWNLKCIFKNTKYISYAIIIWTATGPFFNVLLL